MPHGNPKSFPRHFGEFLFNSLPANQFCLSSIALVLICLAGCADQADEPLPGRSTDIHRLADGSVAPPTDPYAAVVPEDIKYLDELETNVEPPANLKDLAFIDTNQNQVSLKDFEGDKNVVLVFTQGFWGGMLCPYCTTQTSRLVANYPKFQELNTEVLVVYPGDQEHLSKFITAAKSTEKSEVESVPFPILLDEGLSAVDFFGIRSQQAHPSTYVIDRNGQVVLAYVGKDHSADRPSVKKILETLKSIETSQ